MLFLGRLILVCVVCAFVFGDINLSAAPRQEKNTTQKKRVVPNDQSEKTGSAIHWESDFAAAKKSADETGKPIFWYVPTVKGTFMDRKPVIDRYMLAGPFSWPAVVKLINTHFTPLMCPPKDDQAKMFGIEVYRFVEPGFLVIGTDGEIMLSADRLTTLNPNWLFKQIANTLASPPQWDTLAYEAAETQSPQWWDKVFASNWQLGEEEIEQLKKSGDAELELLAGMILFAKGNQTAAKEQWLNVAKSYPEHPLGWKASCESQGIGPFVRGFEVFGDVPESLGPEGESHRINSGTKLGTFSESELWNRSIDYLLRMQDSSGGFFDSDYDFGGYDSLPNVYVAVTSLVGIALIEAREHCDDKPRLAKIDVAIERAVNYVTDETHVNYNDRDEILWAQAYRCRFLSELNRCPTIQVPDNALQLAVDKLQAIQLDNGSWYHEYANAFVTATALNSLYVAQKNGANLNSEKVQKGLKRLATQRHENGAYPYDTRRPGRNDEGTDRDVDASGGRISICELARRQWGEINDQQLVDATTVSLDHHHLMAVALKYDNHTSTLAYGGFFFWYDMQARSEAISMIENQTARIELAQKQRELILALPEIDGCFVDSHELGRCYGTAMALISLGQLTEK